MTMPLQMEIEKYSRSASMDVRDAMAMALRRLIEEIRFAGCQETSFQEVFDDWPSFLDTEVLPAACILPGSWKYDASSMTPKLLEDTWEPQGMPGWGLYKTAECMGDLQVMVRTNLPAERPKLMRAFEDSFQAPGLLMNTSVGARYGLLRPMPEYYGMDARFALLAGNVLDSEDSALREKRDALFTISAIAAKVQLGPVWPMALSISKTMSDLTGHAISHSLITSPAA
jgi:hypothetical protein